MAAITLQLVEQLGEQMDGVGANVQVKADFSWIEFVVQRLMTLTKCP